MNSELINKIVKLAMSREQREGGEKAMRGFVNARPYAAEAFKAGVPAAVMGNLMLGPKAAKVFGLTGAALGATNVALKQWEKRHPWRAKRILGQQKKAYAVPEKQLTIRKVAAMAADLRMKGIGGVKRPPFATEESKNYSSNLLKNSFKPGQFKTHTQPKHLIRPGKSIQQVATLPTV